MKYADRRARLASSSRAATRRPKARCRSRTSSSAPSSPPSRIASEYLKKQAEAQFSVAEETARRGGRGSPRPAPRPKPWPRNWRASSRPSKPRRQSSSMCFAMPATSRSRLRSCSRPTCFSTGSARRCAAAPMCSPISPARSCASGPTSPCPSRGFISSVTRAPMRPRAIAITARPSAFSRKAGKRRARASSARPASNASASPTAKRRCRDRAARGRGGAPRGLKHFALRFGDIGLFYALIDALVLPGAMAAASSVIISGARQRSMRCSTRLAKGERANGNGEAAALAASSPARTQALPRSGRRAISRSRACRLPATARLARSPRGCSTMPPISSAEPLPKEVATVIDYYLAVSRSAQGGDRARRHDRARAPASISAPRSTLSCAASSGSTRRHRSREAPSSPPSSAATSNITRASCSRSKRPGERHDADRGRRPL